MQHDPTLTDLYAYLEHEFKTLKASQDAEWQALDDWRAEETRTRNRLGIGLLILVVLLTAYNLSLTSRLTALEAAVYRHSSRGEMRDATAAGD